MVYWRGAVWLKAAVPFPVLVLVGWRIGVKPEVVAFRWKSFVGWLVLGSRLLLPVERQQVKQSEADALLEKW